MKIVIDHVRGSRRGQRQEFAGESRISIGRHPKNDVSFDAHRDLDASSRHAELRQKDGRYLLTDVGSSNGTFVGGNRVSEVTLEDQQPVVVEFGAGGPELRIWVGPEDRAPDPPSQPARLGPGRLALATLLVAVLVFLVLLVIRLAK